MPSCWLADVVKPPLLGSIEKSVYGGIVKYSAEARVAHLVCRIFRAVAEEKTGHGSLAL